MFADQISVLRSRLRCVAYDHRGQGQSPPSPTPFDMETLFEDAVALIEKLALGPVHFVGLSMGGFIGMRLAARRPELVRSLVLIDTAADAEPFWNIPKYKLLALLARGLGYRSLLAPIMKIMFAPAFLGDPARSVQRQKMADHLAALRDEPTRAALQAVISRQPIEPELSQISAPTLVLHGQDDKAIVESRARTMAKGIRNARFVLIPNAGHTSTVEEPAAVNAALSEFLFQQTA